MSHTFQNYCSLRILQTILVYVKWNFQQKVSIYFYLQQTVNIADTQQYLIQQMADCYLQQTANIGDTKAYLKCYLKQKASVDLLSPIESICRIVCFSRQHLHNCYLLQTANIANTKTYLTAIFSRQHLSNNYFQQTANVADTKTYLTGFFSRWHIQNCYLQQTANIADMLKHILLPQILLILKNILNAIFS